MQVWLFIAQLAGGVSVGFFAWALLRTLRHVSFEKRNYRIRVPLAFKLLLPLAKRLEPFLHGPSWDPILKRTERRLTMGGLAQMYTPEEFVGLRILSAITFFALALFFIGLRVQVTVLFGTFLGIYAYLGPILWLRMEIRRRHRSIQRALPSVLDLLTLSVEAGRDFLTALRDILRHRETDPLGEELERVFREVQLGKQRRQALRAMGQRVQQDDLNTVVETLVQADELGVSIGQILRILAEQMRQKRFSMAEKMANEAPVKMLLPLFLFIFPAVLIVMLGPVLFRAFQLMP